MMSRFSLIVFAILYSHQLFSQGTTDSKGAWYTADGTNELKLFVSDDYVFYQSELWDIDQMDKGGMKISNPNGNKEIFIRRNGEKTILKTKAEDIEVVQSKRTELDNRKVGISDLSKSYFTNDQVLLQGVFLPDSTMPKTISVIYDHAFSDDQKKYVADVDEKGRFKIIYPLDNPQSVMVQIGEAFFTYLASPGSKQVMIVNEKSFLGSRGQDFWFKVKEIDYMGDLAIENEELRLLKPEFMKIRSYSENDSLQRALDSDDYLAFRLELMEKHKRFYQNYFDSIPVSEFVKDYSFRNTRLDAADDLMRYSWIHNLKNTEHRDPADISDEYVTKVKSLVKDEKEELVADSYAALNREFAMVSLKQDRIDQMEIQTQKIFDFLENNISTDSAQIAIEKWKGQVKEKGSISGIAFDNEEVSELMEESKEELMSIAYMTRWDYLRQKLDDFGIYQRSSIVSTFLDQSYLSRGEDIPMEIQNQLVELNIQQQVLEGIYRQIDEFEALKNSKFVEGIEITATSDNILSQLKEKYPGKVVYMDVWATWCGPCISEFGYLKELKKQELDDVVFVYLCGQSPENSYEAMVKKHNLIGDNYFLDNEAFQQFDKEVGISGFPTYLVITKEGKLVREGINRPSSGVTLVNQLKEFASR
tara:strand:+ start:1655 stop:3592 length:1938 start_codon:yes stop_codon:yes gene_type:complete